MKTIAFLIYALLFSALQVQASPYVYENSARIPMEQVYSELYKQLEKQRFWVIFEPKMGKTLSRFKEKWGEDYNRNRFKDMAGLVVCNPWYTNQVGNLDPSMLALCPLGLTITYKEEVSTVLFLRPTSIAKNSPAFTILKEVEDIIIQAVEKALKPKQ